MTQSASPPAASPPFASPIFASPDDAQQRLDAAGYLPDPDIAVSVFLASALDKPLLLEGPAGVGKTELAKAVARASGRTLIRLQCYEGLDEAKALYEWEYGKQLLYTQLLRDTLASTLAGAHLSEAVERLGEHESAFFHERFLLARPLLRAISSPDPVVLLVDEVDRADPEFEALLLEVLGGFTVSIPELGTIEARTHPFTVLTSNATREITDALRRRCLHAFLDYPDPARELEIVRRHVPEAGPELTRQVVAIAQRVRTFDLEKPPSIAETIDWTRALLLLGARTIDRNLLTSSLGVLAKRRRDAEVIASKLDIISELGPSDPNDPGTDDA